ncbi:hypothetical protein SUDANB108_07112 [Streptomyces sp. enrichment culture]
MLFHLKPDGSSSFAEVEQAGVWVKCVAKGQDKSFWYRVKIQAVHGDVGNRAVLDKSRYFYVGTPAVTVFEVELGKEIKPDEVPRCE